MFHADRLEKFLRQDKKSFGLLEMIVYVTLVSLIAFILVDFILGVSSAFYRVKVQKDVLTNARMAMERILQDIRASKAVYYPTSTFDTDPGALSLVTTMNVPSGENITYLDYFVSSSVLWVKAEGQQAVPITSSTVKVTGLLFHWFYSASLTAQAVQVELTVLPSVEKKGVQASTSLISTAALRGVYAHQ